MGGGLPFACAGVAVRADWAPWGIETLHTSAEAPMHCPSRRLARIPVQVDWARLEVAELHSEGISAPPQPAICSTVRRWTGRAWRWTGCTPRAPKRCSFILLECNSPLPGGLGAPGDGQAAHRGRHLGARADQQEVGGRQVARVCAPPDFR